MLNLKEQLTVINVLYVPHICKLIGRHTAGQITIFKWILNRTDIDWIKLAQVKVKQCAQLRW
jgi:hypothetical protein